MMAYGLWLRAYGLLAQGYGPGTRVFVISHES
jgi:hypothetical protein